MATIEAEVVIIGSGLSGTLVALSLLESPNPPSKVVMLEARELCSGATGRNAGHCKPDSWRGFRKYADLFGDQMALKILANERETFDKLVGYVRQHKVNCEAWVGTNLDVVMSDDLQVRCDKMFKSFRQAGGDSKRVEVVTDPVLAERRSRVKGAKAIYEYPAATLHPWKLVAHLTQRALDLGLNLQTWTPALSVTGSPGKWLVRTKRGDIKTPTVIHATNADVGALLSETVGVIEPIPHMCNRVIPPPSFSGSKALKHSYGIMYPNGLYSINSRQNGDGSILVGGSNPNQKHLENYVATDPRRRYDDTLNNFEPVTRAVKDLGNNGFDWESENVMKGNKVVYENSWSGIIGLSPDEVPFVGAVPGKPGQ